MNPVTFFLYNKSTITDEVDDGNLHPMTYSSLKCPTLSGLSGTFVPLMLSLGKSLYNQYILSNVMSADKIGVHSMSLVTHQGGICSQFLIIDWYHGHIYFPPD